MTEEGDQGFEDMLNIDQAIEPSIFGEWQIDITDIDLPSMQSRADARAMFDQRMAEQLARFRYILTGDLSIDVEWYGDWGERYDTGRSKDVDNVIKPLIDSLCGPDRIIIDDNQIHSVRISWIGDAAPGIKIGFSFPGNDFFLPKGALALVHLYDHLYIPLSLDTPRNVRRLMLSSLANLARAYRQMISCGATAAEARSLRPIQRLFHAARIGRFPRLTPWQYIRAG